MKESGTIYPNPWDFHNTDKSLKSMDNRFMIEYYDLKEISMGGPLGGKCFLVTIDGKKIKIGNWCGGPAIWDSKYELIAIPIWERKLLKGTIQKLVVLNLVNGRIKKFRKSFTVLDIRRFENGIVSGYDSLIHKSKEIKFNVISEEIELDEINQNLILVQDKSSISEIYLSSDSASFHLIATILETKLKIEFADKINGLDQKYWDFEYKGHVLTLHLENYLGVSIFIKDSGNKTDSEVMMIELETEIKKNWH